MSDKKRNGFRCDHGIRINGHYNFATIPDFIVATNMSTSDMLSLGLSAKNFNPKTQLVYQQIRGEGKKLYDDILKANNYQIVINQEQVKDIAVKFQ